MPINGRGYARHNLESKHFPIILYWNTYEISDTDSSLHAFHNIARKYFAGSTLTFSLKTMT